MRIRVGTTIDAPPAVVWAAVESIERHVEWMAEAIEIRFAGEQRRGVGTTFECVTRVGPFRVTDRMVVTEWSPGRAMAIEHRGRITGRGRFRLRRLPNGRTRFSWTERLRFPWSLGGPVGALAVKPVLRRIWRKNLHRLAARVASTS